MTLPLTGLRVWITRPPHSAEASAEAWRRAGADAAAVPLLRFETVALAPEDRARLAALPRPWNLVLTSQNAARFLAQALAADADLHRALVEARAFAVGEATARVVEGLGLAVQETAPQATGEKLARMLVHRLPAGSAVVLPGSDQQRPQVREALTAAGIDVTSVVVYHTLPVSSIEPSLAAELVADRRPLLLLYSPSAVGALTQVLAAHGVAPSRIPVAVVGPTTAEAAASAGLRVVAMPDDPGEAALVQSVVAWWSEQVL